MSYPPSVQELLKELQKLPGIGAKTAERLIFHLIKIPKEEGLALSESIRKVKEEAKQCSICFNTTEQDPCHICCNPSRNASVVCVVEQMKDLMAIEKTSQFKGLYHVLLGRVAPLDNEHPDDLTIGQLIQRIEKSLATKNPIKEVILATNPNIEGDTTALFILNSLKQFPIKVTRIARGLPSGSSIEFANQAILTDALLERKSLTKTAVSKETDHAP